MEIILAAICIILIVVLLWEGREYHSHQKSVIQFAEASGQFLIAFETVKAALNANADIQRQVMDRVTALEKAMEIVFAVLDIHDKALGLELAAKLRGIAPFVEPKKLED
jgi:hypothetical protein